MMRHTRKQTIPNKLYFRIGEVSDIVGVKPYVLRYWETEFGDVRPTKSKSGQRLYKRRDVELLMAVKMLLYEERYTIDGAKQRLRETARGEVVSAPSSEGRDGSHDAPDGQLTLPATGDASALMGNGPNAVEPEAPAVEARPPAVDAAAMLPMMGPRRVRETIASRRLLLKLREGLQEVLDELRG